MSPGFPLVITDGEGIDNRLGVIERISRMDIQQKRESLQGLTRAEIGDVVYVVTTDDGTTIRLSRRVEIVAAARRRLEVESHQWTKVVQHSPWIIDLPGGTTMNIGTPAPDLLAATYRPCLSAGYRPCAPRHRDKLRGCHVRSLRPSGVLQLAPWWPAPIR